MLAGLKVSVCGLRFGEGEHVTDYRLYASAPNECCRALKHGSAAHVNTRQPFDAGYQRARVNLAAETADATNGYDVAAHRRRGDWAVDGPRSADFQNHVNAFTAGQAQHFVLPLGRRTIVDGFIRAQFTGSR